MEKNNIKGKTKLIIGIVVSIMIIAVVVYMIIDYKKEQEEDKIAITYKPNLTAEFLQKVKVSDFIEDIKGEIVTDDYIETNEIGNKNLTFKYKSIRNKIKTKTFEIKVIDTEKPKIYLGDTMTVKKGYTKNLTDVILSGDNCDSNPKRTIEGDYDFNKAGTYKLKYIITDESGNKNTKDFTLKVVNTTNNTSTNTSEESKILFTDIVKKHKNENTKIGIDVSGWQGEIDWSKVKSSGVEFAMIRLGYQDGFDGDNQVDKYFVKNIEGAMKEKIEVGVYFNSYAKTANEAKEQAEFVNDKLNGYKIQLPISYDWENWTSFSKCKMSFYDLNNLAHTFENNLKEKGHEVSLYGSKNYLETMWYANEFENVWLANYTSKTSYTGKFQIWQLCNTGKIDGIDGYVDIDVLYK